ncbi:MAG: DHH family phosphoesterase [Candidatus Pacearchaeota archaeon]
MEIKEAVLRFKDVLNLNGIIRVVTHIDTDGLTSAAILIHALKKLDQQFWVASVKQLEDAYIKQLYEEARKKKWKAIFFLDLGSNKLAELAKFAEHVKIIILDHHGLAERLVIGGAIENLQHTNFLFVNPLANNGEENVSASTLVYRFVKELDSSNEELAQFAVLGMIGDILEKTISRTNSLVIEDAKKNGMQVKKGLTIFSTTRALHKALELGSSVFIPGVTGSSNGALNFLRELGIEIKDKSKKSYRTLLDLSREETSRLITGIMLRRLDHEEREIIGNIYLLKLFGRLYDARELSAMVNACGRLGNASLALAFLLNSETAREKIDMIYSEYKHHLVNALNFISSAKKRVGQGYMIVNAGENIKDTIIGTVMSVLAYSSVYPDGTILVGMADRGDKIKVSARIAGKNKNGTNLCSLLNSIVKVVGGESGGHVNAAGALIPKNKQEEFVDLLEKSLQIEEIKIRV